MNFNDKYKKIKQFAQDELDIIEKQMVSAIHTGEPLNTYLVKFLTSPSKRIRSVLAILYTKACNENLSEEQSELLTAVELIHNASLIHDDVIDKSNLRRGHKTLSAEFDNKLAVITGDYIISIAMEKLTKIGNLDIINEISRTIKHMCLGEINQNFGRYKIGTIEDYIEKTKNKTAYLFETTLVCCAKLSKNQHNLEKLSNFGLNTGIAFQIRDDLLNLTRTDPSKPVNNDIEEGIYNAPVIYSGKVDNYLSGIEKTKVLLNNYIKSAHQEIQNLPDNKFKTALEEFLELLNNV